MIEYSRIVDDIRSFLCSSDQTQNEALRPLAVNYARACQEANDRLRRCEEFLQKGLRSEALHAAQTEPALLDLVALLDFPERSQWDQSAMSYGLPAAPRLLFAAAEALNEAYSAAQPLEHLLRQHRRLALARAPLAARLEVMRQIRRIDCNNPVWEEDIATFERARIAQLGAEVRDAIRDDRGDSLKRLLSEVRTTSWHVAPPLELIKLVEQSAQEKEDRATRQRLQTLAGDLHGAVAAFDVAKVRELRDLWNNEAVQGNLSLSDPLWERVGAAFDWLAEQERWESQERKQKIALADLQAALETEPSREKLEGFYRAAVRRGPETIPDPIEQAYRTRMQTLHFARRRRNQLLALAAGAIAAGLGGLIWLGISRSLADKRVTESLQTVKRMRDAGQLFEAEEYLKALSETDPATANTPVVAETTKRVMTEATEERQRLELFRVTLQEAAASDETEAGDQTLSRAAVLARLPEEKTAVQKLRAKHAEDARIAQRRRDQHFRDRLTKMEPRVRNIEQLAERLPEAPQTAQAYREILAELEALKRTAGSNNDLRAVQAALNERLEHVGHMLANESQGAQLAARMTRVLMTNGSETTYGNLMQEYVIKFADSPRGKAFATVVKERNSWEAVIAWNRLVRPWRAGWVDLQPAEAKERAEKVHQFADSYPSFVDRDLAQEYWRALQAVAQRDESARQSAAAELRTVFTQVPIKNLWFIVAGERTYYLPEDPTSRIEAAQKDPARTLVRLRYLDGLTGNLGTASVKHTKIDKFGRAPQSVVADMVARIPANFADRTWEQAVVRIAQQIQSSEDMDPVIQLTLLSTVIDLGAKGSYPLSQALSKHRKAITGAKLDLTKVPWTTPGNLEAAASRPIARKLVDSLPSLKPVLQSSEKYSESFASALASSTHDLVGWLVWSRHNGWSCEGAPDFSHGDCAIGVVISDNDQKPSWKSIGWLHSGKPVIETATAPKLIEGRVVFALEKQR
jgi:hypothetical protein